MKSGKLLDLYSDSLIGAFAQSTQGFLQAGNFLTPVGFELVRETERGLLTVKLKCGIIAQS